MIETAALTIGCGFTSQLLTLFFMIIYQQFLFTVGSALTLGLVVSLVAQSQKYSVCNEDRTVFELLHPMCVALSESQVLLKLTTMEKFPTFVHNLFAVLINLLSSYPL